MKNGDFKKLKSPCDHLNNFILPYSKCQFRATLNTLMAKYWPENYGGRFTLLLRTFHSILKFLGWTKCWDHCRVLWVKEVEMDVTSQCWKDGLPFPVQYAANFQRKLGKGLDEVHFLQYCCHWHPFLWSRAYSFPTFWGSGCKKCLLNMGFHVQVWYAWPV